MKILIVDDDHTNRKLLGTILTSNGYEVIEAGDGCEALLLLEKESIDAVVSDVLMPNMDGYRLCAEVRRNQSVRAIPFIIYTSTYTDGCDEKLALEFGADRFLRKPAPAGLIAQTIEELVARPKLAETKVGIAGEELDVMKQYSETLVRKLEKRNDQLQSQAEALHASKTRLQAIFEAEPDCVLILGRDGKVTEVNGAGLEVFEASSVSELAKQPLGDLIAVEYRVAFSNAVEEIWKGGRSCLEFAITSSNGCRRWLEMHAAPLRDPQGEIVALLGIARDNTARKELEAQFVQAQKMEVVGQLAGGIAHDFNNMLGIIMGFSEIAMGELSSGSPVHEHVLKVFQTAERAAMLTRQLLIFSRKQSFKPEALDLSEVITRIDPMLRRIIGENIKLVTEPEPEVGCVTADAGQIEQVLLNLTVNARDAMGNGGAIKIATSRVVVAGGGLVEGNVPAGDYVLLSVTDEGSGMSDEVKAKIFEAFFTTKPEGKGTGLGLATCQSIVSRWDGHITVESQVGVGTRFNIYLPQVPGAVAASATPGQMGALPRGTETVLIVEDEPGLRELAATILERQGYTVQQAGNGQEALRLIWEQRDSPFDLVLSDMVMPQMGGKMMAEWLQATNPELKMLFTSGYADCGLNGALEEGIDFLAKPYTPSDLARRVRRAIDREIARPLIAA